MTSARHPHHEHLDPSRRRDQPAPQRIPIRVGRDRASPVTPDYADRATFPFTGGTIDKVIVDVTGDCYIDHEAQVRAWFAID